MATSSLWFSRLSDSYLRELADTQAADPRRCFDVQVWARNELYRVLALCGAKPFKSDHVWRYVERVNRTSVFPDWKERCLSRLERLFAFILAVCVGPAILGWICGWNYWQWFLGAFPLVWIFVSWCRRAKEDLVSGRRFARGNMLKPCSLVKHFKDPIPEHCQEICGGLKEALPAAELWILEPEKGVFFLAVRYGGTDPGDWVFVEAWSPWNNNIAGFDIAHG